MSTSVLVALAGKHPERVRKWARQQSSRPDLFGYDFDEDPKGVVQFDGAPVAFKQAHPLSGLGVPTDQAELSELVSHVLEQYRHYIEEEGGWDLLWNSDGTEKPESAAQLIFLAIAKHYLRLLDVEVDREVELGRVPLDLRSPRVRRRGR